MMTSNTREEEEKPTNQGDSKKSSPDEWDSDDTFTPNTCDWCGGSPVTYTDEAHEICENCADQMFGY